MALLLYQFYSRYLIHRTLAMGHEYKTRQFTCYHILGKAVAFSCKVKLGRYVWRILKRGIGRPYLIRPYTDPETWNSGLRDIRIRINIEQVENAGASFVVRISIRIRKQRPEKMAQWADKRTLFVIIWKKRYLLEESIHYYQSVLHSHSITNDQHYWSCYLVFNWRNRHRKCLLIYQIHSRYLIHRTLAMGHVFKDCGYSFFLTSIKWVYHRLNASKTRHPEPFVSMRFVPGC